MRYEKTITVGADTAKYYDAVIASKDMMGEDDTISETAKYDNGFEMDIKICGADNDCPWTEAVLFNEDGAELVCSEVSEGFFGEWELEYDGNIYVVNITRETEQSGNASEEGEQTMPNNHNGYVRCNNCMKTFHENALVYDGDEDMEFCPFCGEGGVIMDISDEEYNEQTADNNKTYKNIEQCADKDILLSSLSEKQLDLIESTLEAYRNETIGFNEPCYEDGTPDFSGNYELIINDTAYTPNGFELTILKWVEDREDTGYMIDAVACYE